MVYIVNRLWIGKWISIQDAGNKPKGRISKRVFQENKARQIFRKTNISYPLIRTRTKHVEKSKEIKQNWTGPGNFEI